MARKRGEMGRQPPDWAWLVERLDRIAERDKLYYQGRPAYGQIGTAIGRRSAVYNLVGRKHWPDYDTLCLLADFAREPRDDWLYAGGFPVPGRTPRVMARPETPQSEAVSSADVALVRTAATMLRDLGATSPEDLIAVWEELQRARRQRDAEQPSSASNGATAP